MAVSKKELVLSAMDRKEVERVPAGFWFHFLDDEIHANAYDDPSLEKKVLDGELRYIEESQPDFVKIMTDGFFSYPNPVVQQARTAAELAKVQPLPDDHPFFTRQIAYAKEITRRYGNEIATFYNIFSAATTVKFMQPGTIDESETFLTNLVREDKEAVKAAFAVISADIAKLARRIIEEAGVTGIYLSLQNHTGFGDDRSVYREVFAPGEQEILRAANAANDYNILHICGYAGHRNELEWYRGYEVKTINWAAVVEGVPLEEGRKVFSADSATSIRTCSIAAAARRWRRRRAAFCWRRGARGFCSVRTAPCRATLTGTVLYGCAKRRAFEIGGWQNEFQ